MATILHVKIQSPPKVSYLNEGDFQRVRNHWAQWEPLLSKLKNHTMVTCLTS